MELVSPGLGLIFWMTISFGCVLLVLRKYAWKPILANIRIRERTIAKSLINARRIGEELDHLNVIQAKRTEETELLCQEMIRHATEESDRMIAQAKAIAHLQAGKIIEDASKTVELHKQAAMREIKGHVARLSLEMAEKVLVEEFSDKERTAAYVGNLLDQVLPN